MKCDLTTEIKAINHNISSWSCFYCRNRSCFYQMFIKPFLISGICCMRKQQVQVQEDLSASQRHCPAALTGSHLVDNHPHIILYRDHFMQQYLRSRSFFLHHCTVASHLCCSCQPFVTKLCMTSFTVMLFVV